MTKVLAFRCSRTGLYYPGDYVEEWGRKYGRGLGPVPVSEAYVNIYSSPCVVAGEGKHTMHPIGNCASQVDLVEVEEDVYQANRAIVALDDPDGSLRIAVMRGRQLVHSETMAQLFPAEAAAAKKAEAERMVKRLPLAK